MTRQTDARVITKYLERYAEPEASVGARLTRPVRERDRERDGRDFAEGDGDGRCACDLPTHQKPAVVLLGALNDPAGTEARERYMAKTFGKKAKETDE